MATKDTVRSERAAPPATAPSASPGPAPGPPAAPPVPRAVPTLAKIVATLGPASDAPGVLHRLIEAGVSVFRLNFSHGDFDAHEARLRAVRAAAEELDLPIAVLGDLPGPKIRVGPVPPSGILLEPGHDVLICHGDELATHLDSRTVRLSTTYEGIAAEVEPGHRVLINDGAVRLLAVERAAGDDPGCLRCRVLVGGMVTTGKGINLPESDIKARALAERDWECVEWAVRHGLDFLAMSFVRRADEVRQLRRRLAGMCGVDYAVEKSGAGSSIPVVAKIEKPQALDEIDEIVEAADAIMVARGDLGVEMDLAQVPSVQKRLIAKADEWGKPCIVATQMLETMIENASPTRAEASDVANAVFDGADAVMLSGETAVGKHPALVVETMRRIVAASEERIAELPQLASPPSRLVQSRYRTAGLAHGAWHIARDIGAKLVVCWSQRGGTARYLSQNGFRIPIIACSSDRRETRRMALLKGVTALCMRVPESGSLADWNRAVEHDLVSRGWARPGDPVVLLAGQPLGEHGATNTVAVHYVGNPMTGFLRH